MSSLFPGAPRHSRTARAWLLRLDEPFGTAVLLRGDPAVRYALLNKAGLCYIEFDHPVRHHYVEHLCAGNLLYCEMRPISFHRDAARALVLNPAFELGEWKAGGQGARSDRIPFYRIDLDEGAADDAPPPPKVPSPAPH